MAWPGLLLLIAVAALALVIGAAFYLQFASRPSKGAVYGAIAAFAVATASLSVYLSKVEVSEDTDETPILAALFLKR